MNGADFDIEDAIEALSVGVGAGIGIELAQGLYYQNQKILKFNCPECHTTTPFAALPGVKERVSYCPVCGSPAVPSAEETLATED